MALEMHEASPMNPLLVMGAGDATCAHGDGSTLRHIAHRLAYRPGRS